MDAGYGIPPAQIEFNPCEMLPYFIGNPVSKTVDVLGEKKLVSVDFIRMGKKTTVCLLTTQTGVEITGVSISVDENSYDWEEGKRRAESRAVQVLEDMNLFIGQQKAFEKMLLNNYCKKSERKANTNGNKTYKGTSGV